MNESVTQTFPCGPSTMIATQYDYSIASLAYYCGKEQEKSSTLKSKSSINYIPIKNLIILFLAVTMAVAS